MRDLSEAEDLLHVSLQLAFEARSRIVDHSTGVVQNVTLDVRQ